MRRDFLARQIVFGVDHPRRPAFWARIGHQRILPFFGGREIDGAEILRHRAKNLDAVLALFLHQPLGRAQLRMDRQALLHIALHARQDLGEEAVGVVFRAHDALDPVAADAVEQLPLLRVGTGNAGEPFAVRQLRGEVGRLAEFYVDGRGLLLGDLDGLRCVELIADRAHRQMIGAGRQPIGRKTEAAVRA